MNRESEGYSKNMLALHSFKNRTCLECVVGVVATVMLGLQPPGPLRSRVNVQSPITTTRGVLLASARHVALADVQRLASVVVE